MVRPFNFAISTPSWAISQRGLNSLNLLTSLTIVSVAYLTSFSVVNLPNPILKLVCASSSSTPSAFRTYEGSSEVAEVQADPQMKQLNS